MKLILDASVGLSDDALIAEVGRLATCEREATGSLIAHLAELYGRRLHLRAGFSSLFAYCLEVLRLSEHEAYDRMKAAKVARRYPLVLGLLATARVNLTTIRLLAPHLTPKNHEELFAAAAGRSKREVQELLAHRCPKPDVMASIRKLPGARGGVSVPASAAGGGDATSRACVDGDVQEAGRTLATVPSEREVSGDALVHVPSPPPSRPLVQPLAPDRYHVSFTATAVVCDKLELARDLLRHAIPNGDAAQIFARALDALVEALVKDKYAATPQPRTGSGPRVDSRHVPAEVKRAVFIRDRGRCVFVGTSGRECGKRAFVEFHHVSPYAAGGGATEDNIALRGRAHNAYEAAVFYGPAREYLAAHRRSAGELAIASSMTRFRSGTKLANEDGRARTKVPNDMTPPP